MVTLVWGGGEGVLGEPPPPLVFLIILKKPWGAGCRVGVVRSLFFGGAPNQDEEGMRPAQLTVLMVPPPPRQPPLSNPTCCGMRPY